MQHKKWQSAKNIINLPSNNTIYFLQLDIIWYNLFSRNETKIIVATFALVPMHN